MKTKERFARPFIVIGTIILISGVVFILPSLGAIFSIDLLGEFTDHGMRLYKNINITNSQSDWYLRAAIVAVLPTLFGELLLQLGLKWRGY